MPTDKFKVSNDGNFRNDNVTPELQSLWTYLDLLAGNHTEYDQAPDEYKAAKKSATAIVIDEKIVWDRTKTTLSRDSESPWDEETKKEFTKAVSLFENVPKPHIQSNVEVVQNYLCGLNRHAARAVVVLIQQAYKFKFLNTSKFNNQFNDHACHLVFPNAPEPQCALKFNRTGLIFSYELKTTSTRLTDGVRFYDLNPSDDLERIVDPTEESKGKPLCNLTVIASIDFAKFPEQKPVATFEVIIQSDYIKYCGPLEAPEIVKLETIQSAPENIERMNFSFDELILDFQAYNNKFGILIKRIIDSRNNSIALVSTILQLFNLVAIKGFWLKNRVFDYLNKANKEVFSFDLKTFFLKILDKESNLLKQLYLLPKDEFVSIFASLNADQMLSLHKIFEETFISKILKAAENLKNNPQLFFKGNAKKLDNSSVDEYSLKAIAHIVCEAIKTIKSALDKVVQESHGKSEKKLDTIIKYEEFSLEEYLFNAIQGVLPGNPFRLQIINPKVLSRFLSKLEMAKFNPYQDQETPALFAFKRSNVQIGTLIETLLNSNPDDKAYKLSIIFVLINEIKTAIESKNKVIKINDFDIKFGKITDEIIAIFYQLDDNQLSKLLRIFDTSFNSGLQFLAIKNAARAYCAPQQNETDSKNSKMMADIFYATLDAITTALKVVTRLKQIEIISLKKLEPPDASEEQKMALYGSEILTQYLKDNPFKKNSATFLNLLQFLSTEEKNPEETLTQLVKHVEQGRPEKRLIEEANSPGNAQPIESETILLIDAHIPDTQRRIKCCLNLKWSERMALLERNPFTKGINDGLMIHFLFHQLFKLDPSQNLTNFLPICDIIAGTIGAAIGHRQILNPNRLRNTFERVWESITDGGLMFEFGLAVSINLYEFYHPNQKHISDEKFFTHLVPAPGALLILYSLWHSLSPTIKERWFPLKSYRNLIENTIDVAWKTLFYSGVCSISALTLFNIPVGNLVQGIVVPTAIGFPLALSSLIDKTNNKNDHNVTAKTPLKNTANVVITYVMAVNFLVLLGLELYNQFFNKNTTKTQSISAYVQMGYWATLFIFGTYSICRHLIRFPNVYNGDPDIIIRKIRKGTTGARDEEQGSGSIQTITPPNYQRLKELQNVSIHNALETDPLLDDIQQNTLIFSNTLEPPSYITTTKTQQSPAHSRFKFRNVV